MNRCPVCGQLKKRSNPQNARLHKLFTEMAANLTAQDKLYHPHQWWKTMCKDRWLGYEEYQANGKTIYVLRSTASLDTEEFTEFMNKVEEYANSRGVYLED